MAVHAHESATPGHGLTPGGTMRAAVLAAVRNVRLEEVPPPQPASGEVLVQIEGCGVCGSDVPVWTGAAAAAYPLPPGAPGHEAWGYEVESGRRVALLSYRSFAEYDVVPVEHVVELPPKLDGLPFPGEALGCTANVLRRAGVSASRRVAVVGVGFLGSAVAQLCLRAGAEVVPVRRNTSLEGLDESFECVVEAAGTQEALDTASRLVATRGRLVIAGYHQGGPRTIDLQSWNWRGIDVVNAHERDPAVFVEGIREAVRLAAAGELDVEALVTHRFPLSRIHDAFEAAATRGQGFVKAWVQP
jgi:NADPH:quinone reductase